MIAQGKDGSKKTLVELVTVAPGTEAMTIYHCVKAGLKTDIDFQEKGTCTGEVTPLFITSLR